MKTKLQKVCLAAGVSALSLTMFPLLAAEQAATPDKTYTGTVTSVNPNERMLHVHGLMMSKDFNLGDSCAFMLPDKSAGTMSDLRPGEKITVNYQDAHGVLVADRVQQEPMSYEGFVKTIDPNAHSMTLHLRAENKTFTLPDDCKIVLRNDHAGAIADIQPGNYVTVTYETPNDQLVARQIAQTSEKFIGTVKAIDLNQKTLTAKATFETKKFNVADNCIIVLNGQLNGQLSDLKPNEKLAFSYDEVNGVNIVNRIGPAPTKSETETTSQPTSPMYP